MVPETRQANMLAKKRKAAEKNSVDESVAPKQARTSGSGIQTVGCLIYSGEGWHSLKKLLANKINIL